MEKVIKFEEVYRKILEYGNECFHCGITYYQIKEQLNKDGLYTEDGEEQIKYLFEYNFSCHNKTCSDPDKENKNCDCEDIYDHLNKCSHFLSKEGCLDLVKLLDSELNNKTAIENSITAANNTKLAKDSFCISLISLLIAFISLVVTIIQTKSSKIESTHMLNNKINEKSEQITSKKQPHMKYLKSCSDSNKTIH